MASFVSTRTILWLFCDITGTMVQTKQIKCFLDLAEDCDATKFPELKSWEDVAKNLAELIEKGTLRSLICGLPEIDLDVIKLDLGALQRTYTVFTFIAHSYIRGRSDEEIIKVNKVGA